MHIAKQIAAKKQNAASSSEEDASSKNHAQVDPVDSNVEPPSKPASAQNSNLDDLLGGPQEPSNPIDDLLNGPVNQDVVEKFGLADEASAFKQVTSDQAVQNLLGQLSKFTGTPLTSDQEASAQQVIDQLKSISDSHSSTVDIQKGIVLAVGSQGPESGIAKLVEKYFPDTAQGIQATFAKSLNSDDEGFLEKIKAAAEDLH